MELIRDNKENYNNFLEFVEEKGGGAYSFWDYETFNNMELWELEGQKERFYKLSSFIEDLNNEGKIDEVTYENLSNEWETQEEELNLFFDNCEF